MAITFIILKVNKFAIRHVYLSSLGLCCTLTLLLTQLQKLRALGEIDNYEKVDDTLWLGDEDDVYKVPRNVVSIL